MQICLSCLIASPILLYFISKTGYTYICTPTSANLNRITNTLLINFVVKNDDPIL